MTTDTDDLIKRLLLRILADHIGHEQRIKRVDLKTELIRLLGSYVGDRKMRNLLEEVRNEERGCWILGSLRSGYFWAKDIEELEKYLAADRHRVSQTSIRIRNQEKHAIRQTPDQYFRLKNPDQMELSLPETANVS